MNVGIKAIDDDHLGLVELINSFEEAAVNSGSKPDATKRALMRAILGRLRSYAEEHFAREEELQQAAGYYGLEENRREHQRLTRELTAMTEQFQSTEGSGLSHQELAKFLKEWLLNHVIKIDLKMKGLSRTPPGLDFSSVKTLLAIDHSIIRMGAWNLLKQEGFSEITVVSGHVQALDAISTVEFDLIITVAEIAGIPISSSLRELRLGKFVSHPFPIAIVLAAPTERQDLVKEVN